MKGDSGQTIPAIIIFQDKSCPELQSGAMPNQPLLAQRCDIGCGLKGKLEKVGIKANRAVHFSLSLFL